MDRITPEKAYAAVKRYGSIRNAAYNLEMSKSALGRVFKQFKDGRTECTVLAMYDIHYPFEDEENINIAIDYAKSKYKIDRLVLGGDCADFHGISKYSRDPFEKMPFHEEVEYCAEQIGNISNQFEGALRYYIKGNHEDRLERYLWTRAPEVSRLKGMTVNEQLELESSGFEYVDNLKRKEKTGQFFSIGRLNFLHGHELGICPMVNPARRYFFKAFDNVMCGHVHKTDDHYQKNLNDQVYGAFTVGCLADMNPDYRPQNEWLAGFAVVEFTADGFFKVNNYKIIDGRVL